MTVCPDCGIGVECSGEFAIAHCPCGNTVVGDNEAWVEEVRQELLSAGRPGWLNTYPYDYHYESGNTLRYVNRLEDLICRMVNGEDVVADCATVLGEIRDAEENGTVIIRRGSRHDTPPHKRKNG